MVIFANEREHNATKAFGKIRESIIIIYSKFSAIVIIVLVITSAD